MRLTVQQNNFKKTFVLFLKESIWTSLRVLWYIHLCSMIDPNNMELELVTPLPVIHIQRGTYVDGQMDPGLDWDLEFGIWFKLFGTLFQIGH